MASESPTGVLLDTNVYIDWAEAIACLPDIEGQKRKRADPHKRSRP